VSWQPDFDVYFTLIEDKPASIVLDLEAAKHAPVASHPLRLSVRVPMLRPRPDGLRDASELDDLAQLEDSFVDALKEKIGALYVGRVVHDGDTTLFLYVGADQRTALDDLPALTGPPPGEYEPEWRVDEDPEWKLYTEFLAPDEYDRQTIWNRRLLNNFTEHGDTLDAARQVDHMAFFDTEDDAEEAGESLREAGFTTDDIEERDDGRFGLQFHRDDSLADGRPDEFCTEVLDIVLDNDGTYDGWGARLVK
jgi:hypothetical protein